MDSVLDFGCIAASSEVISKCHHITNEGSAPALFHVQYDGDPSVTLTPCSGVIAAGATQWLKVELRTDEPRLIDEKALVKLQNRPAVVLKIKAKVKDQLLEVFDLQGAPLSCLRFGPVYFGTSCVEKVILRNNGPQACDWVCLLDYTAAGTEVTTDLQMSTGATLLQRLQQRSPDTEDLSHLLVCVPGQGRLGPYKKTTVTVYFSPIYKSSTAKAKDDYSTCQQDYCLFLLFGSVQSRYGFTHRSGNSSVELAVTGLGLPVSLVPSPSQRFDVLTCVIGQRVDQRFVLQNLCPQLPVNFSFREMGYFTAYPSTGTISPGQFQEIVLSVTPRQQGRVQVQQTIDVLGHVLQRGSNKAEDVTELKLQSFHTITLHLSAVCCSKTKQPVLKQNLDISSAVTNPTGSRPEVPFGQLTYCPGMASASVSRADNRKLCIHHNERSPSTEGVQLLVVTNDHARPVSSHTQCRTIFTGVHHRGPQEEEQQRRQHQRIYADFIKKLRQRGLQRIQKKYRRYIEDVNIGIVPSQGLIPPQVNISDQESFMISETRPNYKHISKVAKRSSQDTTQRGSSQVSEIINTVPSTSQEVADCNRTLTPQELYQIDIGPLFVDYGKVCVQSVCFQKLELINHLSVFIMVQLEVDCPELQGSSPLSHVLPPHSHNTLDLVFQSIRLGPFYRHISFSVNGQHSGQILVQAQVVSLALELSTNQLVLRPSPSLLAQSGYRSSVTIRNQQNHAAEFTWRPVVTDSNIPFTVQPATGRVEPYRELDCEVVWHPSFISAADFDLCVHEGNTQRLHCVAKVGFASVQLAEGQVLFESVPLNLLSIRTAVLHNTGQNHAYYQVLDVCPLPGMMVSPAEGVVPSRGQTALTIHFKPDSVIKFDTRVKIALKSKMSIELRVGGSVAPPNVHISVSTFQFFYVHAGSHGAVPFVLTNRSSAAAQVTFDLSEYTDFSLQLPQPSAKRGPGVSVVEVQANQTVDCSLVFSPTEVTLYDFLLPLMVNGVRCPTASPSPLLPPPSSSTSSSLAAGSRKCVIKPLSVATVIPQSPRVLATALCTPLEMSPASLQFYMECLMPQSDAYTKTVQLKAVCEKSAFWRSGGRENVKWWFDCAAIVVSPEDVAEGKLCTVSPSSGILGPGQFICLVVRVSPQAIRKRSGGVTKLILPLYLGDEGGERGHQPYQELTISLQFPWITTDPPQLILPPVPLKDSATAILTLLASGYIRGTSVTAEVEKVELEDGTKIQPVSIIFPEGNNIPAQDQRHPVSIQNQQANVTSLICSVSFCSAVPLSLCTAITFTDSLNNRFKVKLCAIADSCLLTVWPLMALRCSEQQIVLKTGATAVEVVLQHTHTPSPASCPTSSSSSSFDHNSSTVKNSSSASFPDSDSVSGQTSRDTDISPTRNSPTNHGIPVFPAKDSEEGTYYQNVLLAVEKWFSLFGWPDGPHPIAIPHTLRRVVSKIQTIPHRRAYRVIDYTDSGSVVDMLHHLTGIQIPGIPRYQAFSSDVDQRTSQLLQQHEAMLAFLRVQGAALCHIRPAYLLDKQEFKHWCSQQTNKEKHCLDYSSVDYESLSKRSWTDVLLQIYKVLVLCRMSKISPNTALSHKDVNGNPLCSSQPLASNIYSFSELQLLSWLNMHYACTRKIVWGGASSARWIVNFDLDLRDGLVLAALLAAYCPYLISSHFQRMYTTINSLEQMLHNNIIVSQALRKLRLNIDIQPTDLLVANPVQMLMLCVHLYERLPQYLPVHTITFSGGLHSTSSETVQLKSPGLKPVKYKALIFGENANLFSLPGGSAVTIPPKESTELTVQGSCSFIQPMEAVLLLVPSSPFGPQGSTLAFNLKTNVSYIKPTNVVECKTLCYQLKEIQVPITNCFNKDAEFRVVLLDSEFNLLEPEKTKESLVQQATSKASIKKTTSDKSGAEEMEDDEDSEFLSAVMSVSLKSCQTDTLNILYLPFCPRTKYCSVLLVCPQVGDMVYMVEATAELPQPSPLTARPSSNIVCLSKNSDPDVCVPVLSLRCQVRQVCEEVVRVPLINMAWEQALATWGQQSMSADEYRRRILTRTLCSSTVRATTAVHKLKQQATQLRSALQSEGIEYSVEVSMPQYFTVPSTVTIPIKEDSKIPWRNPADCGFVDIPLRFLADSVRHFKCQMVLRSWCDTRVHMLEAEVTPQEKFVNLDLSSPVHCSVTQNIPMYNETHQSWKVQAELCGEGFSGPKVLNVLAGTKAYYPLTFHPSTQGIVTGRLSLHNDCNGAVHVFTLKGAGEPPLPVDYGSDEAFPRLTQQLSLCSWLKSAVTPETTLWKCVQEGLLHTYLYASCTVMSA